jgi:hypothetical protein
MPELAILAESLTTAPPTAAAAGAAAAGSSLDVARACAEADDALPEVLMPGDVLRPDGANTTPRGVRPVITLAVPPDALLVAWFGAVRARGGGAAAAGVVLGSGTPGAEAATARAVWGLSAGGRGVGWAALVRSDGSPGAARMRIGTRTVCACIQSGL